MGFPSGSDGKQSVCNVGTWVQSLGWEDPLEEGMATHSSILVWEIPMDRGAWWAAVHGVAKSRTQISLARSSSGDGQGELHYYGDTEAGPLGRVLSISERVIHTLEFIIHNFRRGGKNT